MKAGKKEDEMKTKRTFRSGDRYAYDFEVCSIEKGWAQVDTSQDAFYFGTWANPETLKIVNYCEGDVTMQTADSADEFEDALRYLKAWNEEHGWTFHGIDPGLGETIRARFEALGLGDLLH